MDSRRVMTIWILIVVLTMLFPPISPERAMFRQQKGMRSETPLAIVLTSDLFPARPRTGF
jgi:hypothetical protein